MKFRILQLLGVAAVFLGVAFATLYWDQSAAPEARVQAGVAQTNGGEAEARAVRTQAPATAMKEIVVSTAALAALLLLFSPDLMKLSAFLKRKLTKNAAPKDLGKGAAALALLSGLALLPGCMKSYDTPEFEVIDNNETAFVIPMEGDTTNQAKLDSAEALEKYKVATKRIQITHRWNQTGRFSNDGQWIPEIRVIKVKRTPVARQWVSNDKNSGNGIWVESRDSVGFSTGFSVVGGVEEKDTALFLYKYKGNSLEAVMDGEVRARVQAIAAQVSSQYGMDLLREKKEDMITAIKADIIPFFKERGITITTVGNFGGFTYENPAIQDAIDKVFIAQQLKNVAAAQLAAQADMNKKLKAEGVGEADKVREIATGQRDAAILVAEGEAKKIRQIADGEAAKIKSIADAVQQAGQNPLFLEMKRLEVQSKGLERWDGKYPVYMMNFGGSGQAPNLLMQLPSTPTGK